MKRFLNKRRPGLLLSCYSIGVLFWLAAGVFAFAAEQADRMLAGRGGWSIQPQQLELSEIAFNEAGDLVTLSEDPQMLLELSGKKLTGIAYSAQFEREPRRMCLYYTTEPGADFDELKSVEPQTDGQGNYFYWLPPGQTVYALRLDPASAAGLTLRMGELRLDMPRPAWQYFVPAGRQALCLALLPGLAAAGLRTAGRLLKKRTDIQEG